VKKISEALQALQRRSISAIYCSADNIIAAALHPALLGANKNYTDFYFLFIESS
jgi:hypothetical protein